MLGGDSNPKRKKKQRYRPLHNAPLLQPQPKKKRGQRILVVFVERTNRKDIISRIFYL
jgi:hypothetical protein